MKEFKKIFLAEAKKTRSPCSKCGNQIVCIIQENKSQIVFISATGKKYNTKKKCLRMSEGKSIIIEEAKIRG